MKNENHKLVFIVEDNDMYLMMLDYVLSNDTVCRFMSFKTGEECIKNLHLNPMMIILDYRLPGIDGLETFEQIKKHNPAIPVVVLTNSHDMKVARKFLKAGVYDYIEKAEDSVAQIEKLINSVMKNYEEKELVTGRKTIKRIFMGILLFALIVIIAVLSSKK